MSIPKILLVAPKQSYLNVVRKAMGGINTDIPRQVAGVGTVSVYPCGVGVVAMQVKGDYKKMCERMEKAWQKFPQLTRMGVILPGFTEDWMRANQFQVRFTMYMLNDAHSLETFINNRALLQSPAQLDAIFRVAPPKRKRAKKVVAEKKLVIVEREVAPEEAEREEDACVVCFENKITHMCIPCSHFVLCGLCALQVKEDTNICPVCRGAIDTFATPIGK